MNNRIAFSPGAHIDIFSAVHWYELKDPTLAFRFLSELRSTLRRIAQFPYRFPLINSTVRRALLKRFRYSIYYSLDIDGISVIAVIHQRRAPTRWMGRGNGRLK
jgi:plasmid stabilization system protein ParE